MKDITYRLATAADISILIEYRIRFLLGLFGDQQASSVSQLEGSLQQYYESALNEDNFIAIIARHENTVAGMGGMSLRQQPGNFKNPTGKIGYILSMYTVPEFRKLGIAANIVRLLIEEGRKRGIIAFELHATKEGESIYRNQGFEIHHEPTYRRYFPA